GTARIRRYVSRLGKLTGFAVAGDGATVFMRRTRAPPAGDRQWGATGQPDHVLGNIGWRRSLQTKRFRPATRASCDATSAHGAREAGADFLGKARHHLLSHGERGAGSGRRHHEVVEPEPRQALDAPRYGLGAADEVGIEERPELVRVGELAQVGEHAAEVGVLRDVGPRI